MKKPGGEAGLWTVADTNEGLLRPMWRPAGPGRQRMIFTISRPGAQSLFEALQANCRIAVHQPHLSNAITCFDQACALAN